MSLFLPTAPAVSHGSRLRASVLLLASASLLAPAVAQPARPAAAAPERVEQLDDVVVTATRTPAAPYTVGSALTTFSAEDLARRQVSTLAQALGQASLAVASSGAPGASTAIFLRGANSNQTLFLVDGLRFNDPNTDYAVFLGGACVSACDSLEVAHGPQSTLYGGEAVGGVVSLRSQRGRGNGEGRVALEGGSFGTLQGAVSVQGAPGAWAYNVALQGGRTENDRVNNTFESGNLTVRLDRQVNERVAAGVTVRGFQARYGSPGTRFTNDPDNSEREGNWLATTFVNLRHSEVARTHVVLGGQHRRFVSENPSPGRAAQVTVVKNRRAVLDWQTTYAGWERHRLTAGFTAEGNHTRNTGFGDIDEGQSLLAFFAQDEFSPTDTLHLTAGLRHDDFDTFGRHTTGRASAAWEVSPRRVKLRASYGTAFRSPSFLDLYGRSAFYVGNPALKPERARGGDAGVDVYLAERRGTLSLTAFDNRFTDLIVSDFARSPSSVANVGRARTHGVEAAAAWTWAERTEVRLSYTYLEAENRISGARLLRRPRHSGNVDVRHDFGGGIAVGAGVRWVAERKDVHARTFATIDGEDYSVARLHASWTVSPRLSLRARVENVLDEDWEDVHGFPQLPVGGFAGVEWLW